MATWTCSALIAGVFFACAGGGGSQNDKVEGIVQSRLHAGVTFRLTIRTDNGPRNITVSRQVWDNCPEDSVYPKCAN